MEDSFVGYRTKPRRLAIESDSEEDEDLILESSLIENSCSPMTINTDLNSLHKRKSLDDQNSVDTDSSIVGSQGITEGTSISSFTETSDEDSTKVLSGSVVIEESLDESFNSRDCSFRNESPVERPKSSEVAASVETKEKNGIETEMTKYNDSPSRGLWRGEHKDESLDETELRTDCSHSSPLLQTKLKEERTVKTEVETNDSPPIYFGRIKQEEEREVKTEVKTHDSPITHFGFIKQEFQEERGVKTEEEKHDSPSSYFGRIKQENSLNIERSPQFKKERRRSSLKDHFERERRMSGDDVLLLDSDVNDSSVVELSPESGTKYSPANSTSSQKSLQWNALPTTDADTNNLGKRAMKTHLTQRSMTLETLTTLHSALNTCPSENTLADDPSGLKVPLMPHQKHALAWLMWRENERPPGGILADDMGLGKTLTMISLILKAVEEEKETDEDDEGDENTPWLDRERSHMPRGGTLVVCPASLVSQWEKEIKKRCQKHLLSVLLYHGNNRETKVRRIARPDVVITTYNLVSRESGIETAKNCTVAKTPGPLHSIKWKRIILDEAHIVRNHKSQTALAVFELAGKYRWCLTGTPIQNKELDLYSLMKFLRCAPFDDLVVWRRWVDNKNAAGMQRLATMMKSLMLRRTKEQLQEKGALQDLPTKTYETIPVQLDPEEMKVYQKVAIFSSTLFAQFLGQRAEKEQMMEARYGQSNLPTWEQGDRPDNQYLSNEKLAEMYRKMKNRPEVKSHDILVLLLRLRQICCHAGLIKEMLEKEDFATAGVEDESDLDMDLFNAMGNLTISSDTGSKESSSPTSDPTGAATTALSPENPILQFSRPSSKIRAVLDVILEKVMNSDDKAVVVSQWTSMLNIVRDHLVDMGVKCDMLSGSVPVQKRLSIVEEFNSKRGFKILLLSLTAGGVGLNLVGGNHLFLIDVHWNPQLEAQASDRVYRVGQKKPVFIYKFVCQDTVEERIKRLQEQKLALADNVLTGTRNAQASKLTMQDLKMLFGVGNDPFG